MNQYLTEKLTNLILFLSVMLFINTHVFAQQVSFDAFQIKPSDFTEMIVIFKQNNPTVSDKKLTEYANKILIEKGINFIFQIDNKTCRMVKEYQAEKKNKGKPVNLRAKLKSTAGEITQVLLPDVKFGTANCEECYVEMPLIELTEKHFVTKINDQNIKFDLIPNFELNFVALVENDNFNQVRKFWFVPEKGEPLSFSRDFKIIYLKAPGEGLEALTLALFENGVFQFYERKNIDMGIARKINENSNAQIGLINFGQTVDKKLIRYNKPCR